jgi:hypothetical protein
MTVVILRKQRLLCRGIPLAWPVAHEAQIERRFQVAVEVVGGDQLLQRHRRQRGERPRLGPHHDRELLPRAAANGSELLDVGGGDLLRRVGVALDVALRAVPQPPFQLIRIRPGHLGEMKRESVAQVVRT